MARRIACIAATLHFRATNAANVARSAALSLHAYMRISRLRDAPAPVSGALSCLEAYAVS